MIDEVFDRVRFKVIAQLSNDWSVAVRLDTQVGSRVQAEELRGVREESMQDLATPER